MIRCWVLAMVRPLRIVWSVWWRRIALEWGRLTGLVHDRRFDWHLSTRRFSTGGGSRRDRRTCLVVSHRRCPRRVRRWSALGEAAQRRYRVRHPRRVTRRAISVRGERQLKRGWVSRAALHFARSGDHVGISWLRSLARSTDLPHVCGRRGLRSGFVSTRRRDRAEAA
jgi:hypothetical protein